MLQVRLLSAVNCLQSIQFFSTDSTFAFPSLSLTSLKEAIMVELAKIEIWHLRSAVTVTRHKTVTSRITFCRWMD